MELARLVPLCHNNLLLAIISSITKKKPQEVFYANMLTPPWSRCCGDIWKITETQQIFKELHFTPPMLSLSLAAIQLYLCQDMGAGFEDGDGVFEMSGK